MFLFCQGFAGVEGVGAFCCCGGGVKSVPSSALYPPTSLMRHTHLVQGVL